MFQLFFAAWRALTPTLELSLERFNKTLLLLVVDQKVCNLKLDFPYAAFLSVHLLAFFAVQVLNSRYDLKTFSVLF